MNNRNMNTAATPEEKKNGKKKYLLLLLLLLIGLPLCFLPLFSQPASLPVDNISSSESSIADVEIQEPEVPLGNLPAAQPDDSAAVGNTGNNADIPAPNVPTAPAPDAVPTTTAPTPAAPAGPTAPVTTPGDLTQVNTPTVNPTVSTPADTDNNTTDANTNNTVITPTPTPAPSEPDNGQQQPGSEDNDNTVNPDPQEPDSQTKALSSLDWLYNQLNTKGSYLHSIFNQKDEDSTADSRDGFYNKNGGQVDSTGPNDAPTINQQMAEAGCTVGTWRIYKEKANQDNYNIFWTETEIKNMQNGDTIEDVYRMSNYQDETNQALPQGETQVTVGSSEVAEKTGVTTTEGGTVDINTISGGAYQVEDVVETEPAVEE